MKKLLSILLSTLILFSTSIIFTFAGESDFFHRTKTDGILSSQDAQNGIFSTSSLPNLNVEYKEDLPIEDRLSDIANKLLLYGGISQIFLLKATDDSLFALLIQDEDDGSFYVDYIYTNKPVPRERTEVQKFFDLPGLEPADFTLHMVDDLTDFAKFDLETLLSPAQ